MTVFDDITDFESQYRYPSANGLKQGGPTLWICILFVVLFGISTAIHVGQGLLWRKWFIFPTVFMCGIGELIGWAARWWSSQNVFNKTPFTMQISCTIISPTFFSAANFIILGQIVQHSQGEIYSRLSPKRYSWIFLSVDLLALVIQACGGGIASGSQPGLGGHIMLVGIIIQLVAIIVYSIIGAEFVYRVHTQKPIASRVEAIQGRSVGLEGGQTPSASSLGEKVKVADSKITRKVQILLGSLAFSTTLLFIRAVYRTIELTDGWTGRIIETERYFNWLDGGMVILCMFTLNIFHPGWLMKRSD